jgi:uncharacterized membrane protein YqjE
MADSSELDEQIRHALTEIRMVLPGAQALLGFQFITLVLQDFEKLPESMKQLHLASLALMTLAVILLMTPAAYHRVAEKGENTEHFLDFCGLMLLISLVPLAAGIAGDFYVVIFKVSNSYRIAAIATLPMVLFVYGLWFGYPWYRRRSGKDARRA